MNPECLPRFVSRRSSGVDNNKWKVRSCLTDCQDERRPALITRISAVAPIPRYYTSPQLGRRGQPPPPPPPVEPTRTTLAAAGLGQNGFQGRTWSETSWLPACQSVAA